MQPLLQHLLSGIVTKPDGVSINEVAGEASVLLELTVDPTDVDSVKGPDGETLRALRTVLSASSGDRRAVLELIEPGNTPAAE
ncbi:MAG: KH domain-containing protein [Myxococcales bacterium]|nr:KH domain-containing protein [Myxococcales bacterium]